MAEQPQVKVGVAALVVDDDEKMVMGKRKGSALGSGQWQFPGGHLEMGETYFKCAERETLEETGLKVKALKMIAVTDDIFNEAKHYITLFVICRREDAQQQPEALEPHKCGGWIWQGWDDVKKIIEDGSEAVFLPISNLLRDHPDVDALIRLSPQA